MTKPIATAAGNEIYFHRNSVIERSFDALEVGDEVRFVARDSESAEGPQASTVTPEGKQAAEAFNHEGDYRKGSDHPIAQHIYSSGITVISDRIEEMDKRDELIRKANQIVAGQAR